PGSTSTSRWTASASGSAAGPSATPPSSSIPTRACPTSSENSPSTSPDGATGSAVGSGLDAVELAVLAALGHELVVAADLDHVGAVEDDDQVGHANGREAVRHED